VRIASWNVNSIRARRDRVEQWVRKHQPDVLLLQETKCNDEMFHSAEGLGSLEGEYEIAHHGFDHWNGVAILSRVEMEGVQRGFSGVNRPPYHEARLITAVCGGVKVMSLYAPNGRELDDPHYQYKLVWFERLRAEIAAGHHDLVAGDFNVAPADADIYDPVRWRRRTHASPPERAAIDALVDLDLEDVTRSHLPDPGVFTWWSYRPGQFERNHGLRIDLALSRPETAARIDRVWIDTHERGEHRPSDHAPLVLDLHQ